MIANLSDREFIIVGGCTNLRKGFDGLFYQLQQDYDTVDFFNNVGYVFINRRLKNQPVKWTNKSYDV